MLDQAAIRFGKSTSGLADLYLNHADWLTARLRRLGVESPDDVVQETYLRIAPYQARGEVRHPKSLLLRIATNLVAKKAVARKDNVATPPPRPSGPTPRPKPKPSF